jgi:hypothetical protein
LRARRLPSPANRRTCGMRSRCSCLTIIACPSHHRSATLVSAASWSPRRPRDRYLGVPGRNLDDLPRSAPGADGQRSWLRLGSRALVVHRPRCAGGESVAVCGGAFAEFDRALIRIRERQFEGIEPGQAARRLPRAASFTRSGCAGSVISPCTRRNVEVSTSSGVRHQPTIPVSLPARCRGSAATVGEPSHGHRISGHLARRRSSAK